MQPIYEHIKERADLAYTYAKDGAYGTASALLRTLADRINGHWMSYTAEISGSLRNMGEFKSKPGTIVQIENGAQFMVVHYANGSLRNPKKTGVVNLQTGVATSWSDATPCILIHLPPEG